MKILTKHIAFFILFIALSTSNVLAGKIILPESKPKVDEEIKKAVDKKKEIYPKKRPFTTCYLCD